MAFWKAAALAFWRGVGAQKLTAVWVASSGAARAAGAMIYPGPLGHWIGLRENLQETIDFPIKYGAFL